MSRVFRVKKWNGRGRLFSAPAANKTGMHFKRYVKIRTKSEYFVY